MGTWSCFSFTRQARPKLPDLLLANTKKARNKLAFFSVLGSVRLRPKQPFTTLLALRQPEARCAMALGR